MSALSRRQALELVRVEGLGGSCWVLDGDGPRLAGFFADGPSGCGRKFHTGNRDLIGMGVALALSALRANSHTLVDVAVSGFHDALFEGHRVLGGVLEVEIRVVDSPFHGGAQDPF